MDVFYGSPVLDCEPALECVSHVLLLVEDQVFVIHVVSQSLGVGFSYVDDLPTYDSFYTAQQGGTAPDSQQSPLVQSPSRNLPFQLGRSQRYARSGSSLCRLAGRVPTVSAPHNRCIFTRRERTRLGAGEGEGSDHQRIARSKS